MKTRRLSVGVISPNGTTERDPLTVVAMEAQPAHGRSARSALAEKRRTERGVKEARRRQGDMRSLKMKATDRNVQSALFYDRTNREKVSTT